MRSSTFQSSFLRLYLRSLLPVVLPLLMLGAATIYIADNFIGREVVTATSRQLDTLTDTIDATIFELDALNLTFSVNSTIISSVGTILGKSSVSVEDVRLSKFLNEMLNAQINARPYVSSVYFYLDQYPDVLLSTSDGVMRIDSFPDRAWLRGYAEAPRERMLWAETREARLFGPSLAPDKFLTVYRRLFPVGNEFSGVIVMNIARSHFDALIARAALFKGQEIYLLDRDGRLILDNVGGSGSTSALPASLLSREVKALTREKHRGSSYYVYSSRTSRYDWRVVSRIPASSLNSLPIAVRNLILAMLALSLVIGAVLALRAARRNSRRIASIVGLFEKADAGEAVLENTTLAHDEYDQMVETLIRTFLRNRYASLRLSERQAQAQVLELKALRAQMNPHFLFNTLESLYWMVFGTEGLPSPASAMILDLSKLLKYSLEDSEEVALADEIGQAKRYLAIQGFRYKDKFETSWDIEEEALRCRVVKFFLQPLLENAISHGIRNAEGRRSLFVQAELDRSGQALRIRVRDDGVGMDAERLAALRFSLLEAEHPSDHIGLYNTNRHIQLVFGESAGLSIESEAGIGTLVEAHFPLTLAVP